MSLNYSGIEIEIAHSLDSFIGGVLMMVSGLLGVFCNLSRAAKELYFIKDGSATKKLQFRRICKAYGTRVHIDTANARDSLYRASVDFVLNSCS
ncbi:hypothetical protein FRX31_025499, partial [Thalictrum thalictroides]